MSAMPKPQKSEAAEADAKKPYVKPAMRSERGFETMALLAARSAQAKHLALTTGRHS